MMLVVQLVLLATCAAATSQPATAPAADNLLPRYGNLDHQTIWSRAHPEVQPALRRLSQDACASGWNHLRQGDPDTAIKRFNQAWSMCPENAEATWGMAIVQLERAQRLGPAPGAEALQLLDEAVALADSAVALPSPPAPLLHDNAMLLVNRGGMRKAMGLDGAVEDLDRAEVSLKRAEALDPHPMIYETWAMLEHWRGRADLEAKHRETAERLRRSRQ